MTSLTRWILAHRRIIAGFWLLLLVLGVLIAILVPAHGTSGH
jgi:uncharacterized membrane protein YdfJ with MMPL/SSD domain